mmetsp:Transcript_9795/g.14857  ORF Transcript_9795/g.14857 Transcript_9795/m.14857 type:complete len:142 (-) Transcript_9795:619-1044(-)
MPEIYSKDNLMRDASVDEVGYQSRYEELVKKYGIRDHREASTETEKPRNKWRPRPSEHHPLNRLSTSNEASPLPHKHNMSRSTDVYHRHSFGHGQMPEIVRRSSKHLDSEESRLKSADRRTEARASYFRSDSMPKAGKSET